MSDLATPPGGCLTDTQLAELRVAGHVLAHGADYAGVKAKAGQRHDSVGR